MKLRRIAFYCTVRESLISMGNSTLAIFSTRLDVSYIETPTLYWHFRSTIPCPLSSWNMLTEGGTRDMLPEREKLKLNTCLPADIFVNCARTSLSRRNLCSFRCTCGLCPYCGVEHREPVPVYGTYSKDSLPSKAITIIPGRAKGLLRSRIT